MKKKVISVLLASAMVATMFTGCGDTAKDTGSTDSSTTTTTDGGSDTATTDDGAAATTDDGAATASAGAEGSVLNIHCWNEEFKSRLTDHYPGYEAVDATTGKIGDVTVKWDITPSDDNAYQNALDEDLLAQSSAAADDKIDMFLVEADYALKYVDTDYTMSVTDLGLTASDLGNQYKYTQDIVTDSNGVLKGVSWQGCPGILFYNRDIALEVLGTEEPSEVQAYVADWATFNDTAAKMVENGYKMTATVNDTYRVYSNNVTSKWVENGVINIDSNLVAWVNDSKALVDSGATGTAELWSDDWSKGFYGDVFCYFGPAWLINFCMGYDDSGEQDPPSVATNGRWGGTVGPQGFYWGGTWICGATGTDNPTLVADIMKKMTCDADIMKDIVEKDDDFANNTVAMAEMAASDYKSKVMGGQNPLQMYMDGAASIDLSNISAYDQGCNEEFQGAMKNYFEGNATYDEALELFYTAILEKYPELSR